MDTDSHTVFCSRLCTTKHPMDSSHLDSAMNVPATLSFQIYSTELKSISNSLQIKMLELDMRRLAERGEGKMGQLVPKWQEQFVQVALEHTGLCSLAEWGLHDQREPKKLCDESLSCWQYCPTLPI